MQWFCFIVLSTLSVWVIAANAAMVILAWCAKRSGSLTPLLGGFCGMLALWFSPLAAWKAWWWALLVIDLGTGPLLIGCFPAACLWIVRRRSEK